MIGTLVYTNIMRAKYTNPPHVIEYTDMNKMRSKISDLQYFMYKPDYILVEFNGYVFNVTNENQMDEFYNFLNHEKMQLADEWLGRLVREVYDE